MSSTLWIGPAASGKTQMCVDQVREASRANLLSTVWAVLPDPHQARAFRRRLASSGGALGVRVGTFGDLYDEVLAQTDALLPLAPEPVLHRLIQTVLDQLADEGRLAHYGAIKRRPGLTLALNDLFAEWKRSRVAPERLIDVVADAGPRLEELAAAYDRYQMTLIRSGWADNEGRGWLAIEELNRNEGLGQGWHIVIDGFDSYTATQRDALKILSTRCASLTLTLTGDVDMSRSAYRRFRTTLQRLEDDRLPFEIRYLRARSARPLALRRLADSLFQSPEPSRTARRAAPSIVDKDAALTLIEAQTAAFEARETIRWLKARHLRDGVALADCIVIARDLSTYEPYLRESAREFGVPLAISTGAPLIDNPAIAALLEALTLPVGAWVNRSLSAVVRSPYLRLDAFGLAPRDALRLEAVARAGQVVEGLDQWREAFDNLAAVEVTDAENLDLADDESLPPTAPRGAAARRLADSFFELASRLTPEAAQSRRDYVVWTEDLIELLQLEATFDANPDTLARDKSALSALREIFAALILSDDVLAAGTRLPYVEFVNEVRGAVEAARYHVEQPEWREAVLAMDLRLARGVPYMAVAVLGLSESQFPAPLTEDPFLSDDERRGLQERGLPLEPRLRSDQQSLFYEAVTRADRHLLLTRSYLAPDGEFWQPSPYWEAVRSLVATQPIRVRAGDLLALTEAASDVEALEAAMAAGVATGHAGMAAWADMTLRARGILQARLSDESFGPYDGDLSDSAQPLGDRFGPTHVWSASRLEAYGSCGFQFFVGSGLGLQPRDPVRVGLDSAQLGTLVHEILENVYQAADPDDVGALVAALPAVAEPIFAAAPRELGFRPTSLWTRLQTEVLDWIADTLREIATLSVGYRPIAFEQRFSTLVLDTPRGPVRLRGVIDRVDRNAAGELRVIDYKTGGSHLDPKALERGIRLQLPLYAAAAEQALNLGTPVDGLYWSVRSAKPGRLTLADFSYTDERGQTHAGPAAAIELAAAHIGQTVAGVRAGIFPARAPDGGCPDYCPAAAFCWHFQPSR